MGQQHEEQRALRQADQQDADNSASDATRRDNALLTVGLVPAPELPERIARVLADELAELLENYVDDCHRWQIDITTDPLIGAEDNTSHIIAEAEGIKQQRGWDYVICLTDLPIFRRGQLVVAEASEARRVAIISQPALGASPMRRRIREAILQLVNEMHHGSSRQARDHQQQRTAQRADRSHGVRNQNALELVGSRLSERIAPIRRVTPDEDEQAIDVRFVASTRLRGHCKLLAGMVRANRPWNIFSTFKRVVAAAFATGAYGLIFPTLWRLSDAYEPLRFMALMVTAIMAMVLWIIIDHDLWEPQKGVSVFPLAKLYNLTTIITLGVGVLFYYLVLFVLFSLAVLLFVPTALLQTTLGHEISLFNYLALAWLATSVATVAGALGAGLESDEAVRAATYGYRQKLRHQRAREAARRQQAQDS